MEREVKVRKWNEPGFKYCSNGQFYRGYRRISPESGENQPTGRKRRLDLFPLIFRSTGSRFSWFEHMNVRKNRFEVVRDDFLARSSSWFPLQICFHSFSTPEAAEFADSNRRSSRSRWFKQERATGQGLWGPLHSAAVDYTICFKIFNYSFIVWYNFSQEMKFQIIN